MKEKGEVMVSLFLFFFICFFFLQNIKASNHKALAACKLAGSGKRKERQEERDADRIISTLCGK